MKISKLIKELEKMKNKHGDLEVGMTDNSNFPTGPLEIEYLYYDEYNNKIRLCD